MAVEEYKIVIKKDDSALKELRQNLSDAKNSFIELQRSASASSSELNNTTKKVLDSAKAYNDAKRGVADLAQSMRDPALKEKLHIADNISAVGESSKIFQSGIFETITDMTELEAEKTKKISEKESEAYKNIMSSVDSIVSKLGIGANTFIGTLLNGLQTAIGLVNNIASILSSIAALSSGGGGILSSIFSFLGFESGGYTGYGATNQLAGFVHAGEYVVPAYMSSIFPMLERMRTGGGYSPGNYMYGGNARAMSPMIQPIVLDTKISGPDIALSQRRTSRIISNQNYN